MRLPCHLRLIRGERTLGDIAALSGVNRPELSRIEQGIALPKDRDIEVLEQAYEAEVTTWYPARVLLAVEGDGEEAREVARRLRASLLSKEEATP